MRLRLVILPWLCLAVAPTTGAAADGDAAVGGAAACPTLELPARPAEAPGGREFVDAIRDLIADRRRGAILEQLLSGNVPEFLRQLQPVTLRPPARRAPDASVVVCVARDYLAVGSDDDFVRVPLGLYGAVVAARGMGQSLPTRKIVDAIYREADVRLKPLPMAPGPRMTSVAYFWEHHRKIEELLAGRPRDLLVAGHKKDLVLTRRLATRAGRVAIYGWHRETGDPIQPLSTIHEARYRDYSHGVRLVATTLFVDGKPRPLFDLLEDPAWAGWLSYEGVIPGARRIMALPLDPPATPPAEGGP